MKEVVIRLPDELLQRAERAGLLSHDAIQRLLQEAIRREAGRKLCEITIRLHEADVEPMGDDEIVRIVQEVRAESIGRRVGSLAADGSVPKPPGAISHGQGTV